MSNEQHQGLPVPGYRPQSDEAVKLVRMNKEEEERVLRILDDLAKRQDINKALAVHRADGDRERLHGRQPGRVPAGDASRSRTTRRPPDVEPGRASPPCPV